LAEITQFSKVHFSFTHFQLFHHHVIIMLSSFTEFCGPKVTDIFIKVAQVFRISFPILLILLTFTEFVEFIESADLTALPL